MNNKTTIMVSLDTSTSNTGLTIWENGKYYKSFLLTAKKTSSENTVDIMCKKIIDQLNTINPVIVVIETPVVVRNAATQRALTLVYGVVYGWCLTNHCEFQSMRPTEWRKWVQQGSEIELPVPKKGEDQKIKRENYKKWALDCMNVFGITKENLSDDEAESILLGYAYIIWFQCNCLDS